MNLENKNENILISSQEISEKISLIGNQLTKDYNGKKLYVLSLLRGSFIFTADLVRKIDLPVKIGFMATSSYGNNEISNGNVTVTQDVNDNLEDFDVLIVDDIMDSGITMKFVMDHIKKMNPNSIKCCVLLDKPERRKEDITPDYRCFTIPDVFVVGYGLNYGDYYRNKPYVFNWEEK